VNEAEKQVTPSRPDRPTRPERISSVANLDSDKPKHKDDKEKSKKGKGKKRRKKQRPTYADDDDRLSVDSNNPDGKSGDEKEAAPNDGHEAKKKVSPQVQGVLSEHGRAHGDG